MPRTTKVITFSLPLEMAERVRQVMAEEDRTMSELPRGPPPLSRAERFRTTWVSTSSDYVRVMDQRLCQWLLCQANSYPVR